MSLILLLSAAGQFSLEELQNLRGSAVANYYAPPSPMMSMQKRLSPSSSPSVVRVYDARRLSTPTRLFADSPIVAEVSPVVERVDPSAEGVSAGWTLPFTSIHERIQQDVSGQERILEFGPGHNPIFNVVRFSGIYHGVEPNKAAFDIVKSEAEKFESPYGVTIELFNSDMQKFLNKAKDGYTKIVALHVLHYFDPVDFYEALGGIHSKLQNGGKTYIAMNAASDLEPTILDKRDRGDLWPGFMIDGSTRDLRYHQTHQTMRELMEAFGFKVIDTTDHIQSAFDPDVQRERKVVSSLYVGEKTAITRLDQQKLKAYYQQAVSKRLSSWGRSNDPIPVSLRNWSAENNKLISSKKQ